MKPGQKVYITEKGKDYFGKYTGTEGIIHKVYPDGGTIDITMYDGQIYVSPISYIKLVDLPSIPDIIDTCMHSQKRYVILSKTLKYWYCPECKNEV